MVEGEVRAEGKITGHRLHQGLHRGGCTVSRQAGGKRSRLHGQGWDRLVSNVFSAKSDFSNRRFLVIYGTEVTQICARDAVVARRRAPY